MHASETLQELINELDNALRQQVNIRNSDLTDYHLSFVEIERPECGVEKKIKVIFEGSGAYSAANAFYENPGIDDRKVIYINNDDSYTIFINKKHFEYFGIETFDKIWNEMRLNRERPNRIENEFTNSDSFNESCQSLTTRLVEKEDQYSCARKAAVPMTLVSVTAVSTIISVLGFLGIVSIIIESCVALACIGFVCSVVLLCYGIYKYESYKNCKAKKSKSTEYVSNNSLFNKLNRKVVNDDTIYSGLNRLR